MHNFQLISRLAKLPRKVKNMANIRVSAIVFGGCLDYKNYRSTFQKIKLKFDCWPFSTKCVITVTNSRHRMTVSNSAEKACSKLFHPSHNC